MCKIILRYYLYIMVISCMEKTKIVLHIANDSNKCKFAEKNPQEDKHWVRGITRFVYKNIY